MNSREDEADINFYLLLDVRILFNELVDLSVCHPPAALRLFLGASTRITRTSSSTLRTFTRKC